jgi:hypothetical protein
MTFYGVPEHNSRQLSAAIGLQCDKVAVFGDMINTTLAAIAIFTA